MFRKVPLPRVATTCSCENMVTNMYKYNLVTTLEWINKHNRNGLFHIMMQKVLILGLVKGIDFVRSKDEG